MVFWYITSSISLINVNNLKIFAAVLKSNLQSLIDDFLKEAQYKYQVPYSQVMKVKWKNMWILMVPWEVFLR